MKVIEQKPNLNMNRHYICGKAGSDKTSLLISSFKKNKRTDRKRERMTENRMVCR
jgi:hypothetical protein